MRNALAGLGLLMAAFVTPASADPYRYCALLAVEGGATNCYFVTLQQCQLAVSGNGGFCSANPFYTGTADGARKLKKRG
jgi:Protein of unknown function (DUF3551)